MGLNSLEMRLQLVVVLEAGGLVRSRQLHLLDIALAKALAHEALLVPLAHMLEQLVCSKEGLVTELIC